MSLLTDLINLNLSDCTDKIIAEYIWYATLFVRKLLSSLSLVLLCPCSFRSLLILDIHIEIKSSFFSLVGGSGMDIRSKARV
ncbi:hypothetical protein BHM03_00015108 [Ensete ventricosum]|nr:hypothetical protein BHM03_00015108 [Ensete ventricosum]